MYGDISRARDALTHENPQYTVRPSSGVSGISKQVEPSPVYMLEWDRQGCRQVYLEGVDQLRAQLETSKPSTAESGTAQRVLVVHGLPNHLIGAIRTSLDIDPAFLEAHAGRRRYRPLRWRKTANFVHYDYPELLRGFATSLAMKDEEADRARPQCNIDLLTRKPAIRSIGGGGDLAATFCHASLWIASTAYVLFLDRPDWWDPRSALRKARRQSSVVKPYTARAGSEHEGPQAWNVELAQGDEISSLEDVLHEALKDAAKVGDSLVSIFARISFDHWLEFFELLEPDLSRAAESTAVLYWQVVQSLEQNADMAQYLARHDQPCAVDWASLLPRAQIRIDLLPVTSGRAVSVPSWIKTPGSSRKFNPRVTVNSSYRDGNGSRSMPSLTQTGNDNKRSLDRISYLGGLLMPLPIVSGILAMGDTYGPGGPKFYVYWVVSIPLSAIGVVIIYADIIRKLEVWVEVHVDNVSPTTVQLSSGRKSEVVPVPVDVRTERKFTMTWPFLAGAQPEDRGRPLREAINEELFIGLPAAKAYDESSPTCDEGEIGDTAVEPLELPHLNCILEQPTDPSLPKKAWKRQKLGWTGAVQTIAGYRKLRRAEDVPPGVLAFEKPSRRKTVTL